MKYVHERLHGFPAKIIRDAFTALHPDLLYMYQLTLNTGIASDNMKSSTVVLL